METVYCIDVVCDDRFVAYLIHISIGFDILFAYLVPVSMVRLPSITTTDVLLYWFYGVVRRIALFDGLSDSLLHTYRSVKVVVIIVKICTLISTVHFQSISRTCYYTSCSLVISLDACEAPALYIYMTPR